ncbi:MAG: elongation factor 4 [Candidatus Levybacteria bacterium RIFCSPLOWO2_02_FULL_37_10]|nr:MAG: elongation factor 4 [Candidatus Levybacteria bacterium RIFCSPHIGHO2_01_FULL_37_33]OGH32382.1 MAG: elongation factor 4 [Candidatus Levybacteria bacterium RIFCSPLOWO2_01_FULL_36_54]OGH46297.1 MAG: elongation factor 4 [Candidatus Levybacteria bacterium RIFCSPLOWO2_02_FULL_37_10]
MKQGNIRNFAIIAHIDHGKSTLADRIMEICGAIGKKHQEQILDSLELEREHGITIKLKAIRLNYQLLTINYQLNLLDTPGHVDFSYEVSRSLASVEGAILVVDATQGVQAQTLSNFNLAIDANLTLIPVINKIDTPAADVDKTAKELIDLGFKASEIVKVSAKTGENVEKLLGEIIKKIPAPDSSSATQNDILRALIFDSSLDPYKGVIVTCRLFGGSLRVGDEISFLATKAKGQVLQAGFLNPKPHYMQEIKTGEVGFIVTNIKDLSLVKVGDTITHPKEMVKPLPGYRQARPVVFLSFFPTDSSEFQKMKEAFEKLKLNDAALAYSPESSISLGQGLRVGFLGLLHAQITQERLEREYGLDIIVTSPSVNFIIDNKTINRPSEFNPSPQSQVEEPYAKVTIFAPQKYYGQINELIYKKRGKIENSVNIGVSLKIEAIIPVLEILIGFYDDLKSQTSGFASFDFEVIDYRPAKLVKLDILVNYEPVEGLSQVVPIEKAEEFGRKLVAKLKEEIPRQNIPIPLQAVINFAKIKGGLGGKILARETIAAYRKDVTAKLYGGDVTRKTKLLEKQKKGKKRMKKFGQIEIPQEAFLAVLKI